MRIPWRFRKWWHWAARWAGVRRASRAVRRFPIVKRRSPHSHPSELIVSVTSYPARFATLHRTLKSLLDQNIVADRTILWLAETDIGPLPANVIELCEHGLEIRTAPDFKSYKKLVPSLLAFPESTVVTADDDLYFRPDWLQTLVSESADCPRSIIAMRGHLARLGNDGYLLPYETWELETRAIGDESPRDLFFATTGAGVLFPPRCLPPEAVEDELFIKLAPDADDLWFFCMARMKGTRLRRVSRPKRLLWWDGSQDVGLWHSNMADGGNDLQATRLQQQFGPALAWGPAKSADQVTR
jgi:hypothetical protein